MNITDSVLTSIKKLLGIAEEYEHFDADLIMHINSVFSILTQLGVGPSKGFMIEDKSATWKDFISDESKYMLVNSSTSPSRLLADAMFFRSRSITRRRFLCIHIFISIVKWIVRCQNQKLHFIIDSYETPSSNED